MATPDLRPAGYDKEMVMSGLRINGFEWIGLLRGAKLFYNSIQEVNPLKTSSIVS